jgi:hypothetical protein
VVLTRKKETSIFLDVPTNLKYISVKIFLRERKKLIYVATHPGEYAASRIISSLCVIVLNWPSK